VAFSPDDRLVLVGSYDGELTLWQIEDILQDMPSSKRLLYLQPPHDASKRTNAQSQVTAGIIRVALSPDSRYAAAADHDGTVRIWKVYKKESPDE
jgi:WD40 repeat protein